MQNTKYGPHCPTIEWRKKKVWCKSRSQEIALFEFRPLTNNIQSTAANQQSICSSQNHSITKTLITHIRAYTYLYTYSFIYLFVQVAWVAQVLFQVLYIY